MPSELASRIYDNILSSDNTVVTIDLALREVREVVELVAHPKFTTDEHGKIRYYLTKSDVEAARTLYQRLLTNKE